MKYHCSSVSLIPKIIINLDKPRMRDLIVVDPDLVPTDWMVIISGVF